MVEKLDKNLQQFVKEKSSSRISVMVEASNVPKVTVTRTPVNGKDLMNKYLQDTETPQQRHQVFEDLAKSLKNLGLRDITPLESIQIIVVEDVTAEQVQKITSLPLVGRVLTNRKH